MIDQIYNLKQSLHYSMYWKNKRAEKVMEQMEKSKI